MKVALSFHGCHRRGGVERIMFECARFLAQREHDVTVYANEWEEDANIYYHFVPMQRRPVFMRAPSYFRESTRILKTADFDVMNTHGCVCPTGGVHWVQSVHKAWLERAREFRPPFSLARARQKMNPMHPFLLNLEEQHFRRRDYQKLIATTEEVKADLKHCYGVPAEDVVVIPNGFSPTEFNPERRVSRRAEMRAQLGLTQEHIALLFVGNELERKGYRTILAALRQLKRPDIRLLVVGKPDVELVKQEAARFGVSEQVIACGPSKDVSGLHAASDIFVLPTQYEAFCLAILEALGSGLPVVTTNIPGAYDAIKKGVNGYLIEDPKSGEQLAEALQPLLDCEHRLRITEQVADTVKIYQWPTVLLRYEQVLREHSR